jgi:transcriptional regulator with XRE-family HTH domain
MEINDLLREKGFTKYRLSKISGVPYATVSDICSGKARIEKCAADTLYKLAKAFGVTMEELIAERLERRPAFDTFKSNVCHMVKNMGDIAFIIDALENDKVRYYFEKKWYLESLYLLAMVDYLSRENDLPLCSGYNDIRAARLQKPVYPLSILVKSAFAGSDQPLIDSYEKSIPEFKRFNIVENEIRNVC